ncbi:polymer-forming cytoskeletal protein [Rhodoferax sp.]|uniref:bactofilin family protein n=1 Tax=Rhodoferax sp. TaxID=50421 RepID=UPI002624A348|nr:polymer-forming cytoskeletal protein [Rhodoferax sp.]MDD2925257.1 polymer-forming cytoskeletal protein [Rhodoferax sp.]
MFNRKKQPPIKSLIAHGCQIDGNFVFSDGLRVDGGLTGNIVGSTDHPSILVISESAVVKGEVQADHIIINGRVEGPVLARAMLELQPKARITGDVTYQALEMHQGAIVAGRLCPILVGEGALLEEKPTLKLAANNQ